MKRIVAFLMSFLCMVLFAFPVNAAETNANSEKPIPYANGNGYASEEIKYAGKYYNLYLSANYDVKRAIATTKAWTSLYDVYRVKLGDLTVNYVTKNYGNVTETGGGKGSVLITQNRNFLESGNVSCRYGSSQVLRYTSIRGSAYFTGNGNNRTLSVTMTP